MPLTSELHAIDPRFKARNEHAFLYKHPAGPFLDKHPVDLQIIDALTKDQELEKLMTIQLAHVGSSANLPTMAHSAPDGVLQLQPTGKLLEAGIAPFGGEMEIGIIPGGVNEVAVSFFSTDQASTRRYAEYIRRAENPWRPNNPPKKDSNYTDLLPKDVYDKWVQLRLRMERMRNTTYAGMSAADKNLVDQPFAIIWGVNSTPDNEMFFRAGGISGERAYATTIALTPENTIAFIPQKDLARAREEFARLGITIPTRPFELLFAVQTIKQDWSPTDYRYMWWIGEYFDENHLDPKLMTSIKSQLADFVSSAAGNQSDIGLPKV